MFTVYITIVVGIIDGPLLLLILEMHLLCRSLQVVAHCEWRPVSIYCNLLALACIISADSAYGVCA